ncbi:NADH-quinone oxidoreductase subunit L [Castellaniella caeni]|uniref:NADH-quinone oxidoreductase subunit L n=1 Tax=Castellaniella caeni TaxID=266123 RepID=UPI0008304EE2|nr:NADH-quinone oxidoreductase subunit L [Castellaniella caeni]
MSAQSLYLLIALAPLFTAVVVGFFGTGFMGSWIGRRGSHTLTILGVLVSFVGSLVVLQQTLAGQTFDGTIYTWSMIGTFKYEVGFLIDPLSALMMVVVSGVSLMVHIYTIGYMAEDPGYNRFFSYISLFTFSMLMLVMANNMLQLFFGWEAVGLVSYLLIGFYYSKPSAVFANLKAFMVNRVGDFGFVLGIGLLYAYAGSLNYGEVFAQADKLGGIVFPGTDWQMLTVACLCLFVGAMGKSAQAPLHVWLPDSMEGPTPISALIHAATMVTAGIFMVARFSPVYELSETALSVIMVIGAFGAFFLGILGVVQNDIKRVVAYSTLSQLGYMVVALGASAYSVAIFHLMTHAFFKALLFLGSGSVIMGMLHDQDMRHMGGLWKRMPITWITMLIGTLALVGTPFFSGFYSKESIISAAHAANIPGAGFAYALTLSGVFVTSLYSFRLYFLVFHGKERYPDHVDHDHSHDSHWASYGDGPSIHALHGAKPKESPWVVTLPLSILAFMSVVAGVWFVDPLLFGGFFGKSITVLAQHPAMAALAEEWHGWVGFGIHGLTALPFLLLLAGFVVAWYCWLVNPAVPAALARAFKPVYDTLLNKYYFDWFNERVVARFARGLGRGLWQGGDRGIIDGIIVNGSARMVGVAAATTRLLQSGYIYHYAFAMIIGIMVFLTFFVLMVH